jgi:DNA-3-methyladenine glycosylase
MGRIVKAKVWRTKKTVALARWLLGKHLVRRRSDGRLEARLITEVEAYHGERDLASHARAGRTRRTAVMYGPGGHWYVYLCYGVHEMLNLVTGPRDWPAAILIRGVAGISGPGRLTRSLGIDRRLNGRVVGRSSGLWIEDRGGRVPRGALRATPRIGVAYAGPVWSKKPWRFTFDTAIVSSGGIMPLQSSFVGEEARRKGGRRPPGGGWDLPQATRARRSRTTSGQEHSSRSG